MTIARTPRATLPLVALALFALGGLAALALAGPAAASSYSGTGDWVLDVNTTEVVVNETIVVNGFLLLNGSLELVNSTVTIGGRLPPIVPLPAELREGAKAYVNGSLTLTNSTLIFHVPFGGPLVQSIRENSPVGLRVGGSGSVTLRDFDNDSTTTGDASFFTAFGDGAPANGSYSTFAPGSRFTMLNSRAELLGFRGYPGFEFNGSTVRIEGSWFNWSHNLTVLNNCFGAVIANLTLTDVEQGLSLRGGGGHRISLINFSGFTLAVQATGVSDVLITDVKVHGVIPQNNYGAWPTPGTSFAINNTVGLTVLRLLVEGNLTDPSSEYVRLIEARSSSNLRLEAVDLGGARGLGVLVNVRNITLERVIATGFMDGLTLTNVSDLWILNSTIVGDAPWAVQATGGSNYHFVNYSAGVRNTLWLIGVTDVTVLGADLNATQVGMRVQGGGNFDIRGVAVRGVGTGLLLDNIAHFFADRPVIEFGENGIVVAFSQDIVIAAPTLVAAPAMYVRRPLFLTYVTDVSIWGFDFRGTCEFAGRVVQASNLSLDGFSAKTCGEGLDIEGAVGLTVRNVIVAGMWNGTGLTVSSTSDATVDHVDASGAWGYAVALGAVDRLRLSNVDGRGGGAGGLVMLLCGDIEVTDGDFSGSGGTAVALFNSTGPVRLLRVNASDSRIGVEVLGSRGASLQDMDVSRNQILGVDVDAVSTGAALRNLTVGWNGGDGIFVGANGTVIVDGNITSNAGSGLEGGIRVRVDWTIETAGSLRNDSMRLKGTLVVRAGATFDAQDALIRVDEGTSMIDPLPAGRFQFNGTVTLTRVNMRAVNASRPYGAVAGPASTLYLSDSTFEGSAEGDVLSRFEVAGTALVSDCTFSGWTGPLDGTATWVDMRRTTFSNNTRGPSLGLGAVYLEDVTSEANEGIGLNLGLLSRAELVRLDLRSNSGLGLLVQTVTTVVIRGLNLTGNLMGGASIIGSDLDASGIVAVGNIGFALRVDGGPRAHLADVHLLSNTGWGLHAAGTTLEVEDLWITLNGGNGVELHGPMTAVIRGGQIANGAAAGLHSTGATVTVEGVVFEANAGPHLWIRGTSVATVANASFRVSSVVAVMTDGSANLQVLQSLVDDWGGRVFAHDSSYAYILNTSFTGHAADGAGQVDVAWDMRLVVLHGSGLRAAGAQVEVRNATGTPLGIYTADGQGEWFLSGVMEKSVFGGGRERTFTPHSALATLQGFGSARRNVTVDAFTVVTLRLDDEAPVVSVLMNGPPGSGGWFLGAVTVTLEASDGGGYGLSVLWRLGGGPWQEYATPLDYGSAVFIVGAEGDTLLEYYGSDGAGNVGAVQEAHVLIDLAPPLALWLVPESARQGRNLTLAWGGTDGLGSGVASFTVEISYEGEPFRPWQTDTGNGSAPFTGDEGDYSFRLAARDAAGRSSDAVLLRVDVVFTGMLRLTVVDGEGRTIPAATVEVVGANQSQTGGTLLSFRLPEGRYDLRISAPGFKDKAVTVDVVSGNTTDLGALELEVIAVNSVNPGGGLLLPLLLIIAAAAAVALLWYVRSSRRRQADEWESAGEGGAPESDGQPPRKP